MQQLSSNFLDDRYLRPHHEGLNALKDAFDGRSFLITGATGVVGLHILNVLNKLCIAGATIKAQLLSSSGSALPFPTRLDTTYLRVDCSDMISLTKFRRDSLGYDFVVHAAGYGQPNRFMSDPLAVINVNTLGTHAMLEIAKISRSRFVFLSTSEIYSGSRQQPFETTSGVTLPQHPRAPYIEAKRLGETLCEVYRTEGASCSSVRLALAYGPGPKSDDGRVLNQFIVRSLKEGRIRLADNGAAVRSYIFGSDAAVAILNILARGKQSVYNIGGQTSITVSELAGCIGSLTGASVHLSEDPNSSAALVAAPPNVSLNTERYESEFGKLERIPLRDGLRATIDWYRNTLN